MRRLILFSFLTSLICLLLCPREAVARDLVLSHQWPETDARHRAARVIARELQRRSSNLSLKIHAGSSLKIGPIEQYAALLDGRIDMAIYPPTYLASKIPEFAVTGLPGVPASVDGAGLLVGTEFERLLQQLCIDKGFRFLTWWWVGGAVASRTVPIKGPETVKGLTLRGGGDHNTMLAAAGAKVVEMPSSRLRETMQMGKLDAVFTSLESLMSFNVAEQTRFVTFGGFGLWIAFSPVIIANRVWNELSEDEQEQLTQAAAVSNGFFEITQREAEESAVAAFEKAGATVHRLTFEEYAAWITIAKGSSWQKYQSVNETSQQLFTALLQGFVDSAKPPR